MQKLTVVVYAQTGADTKFTNNLTTHTVIAKTLKTWCFIIRGYETDYAGVKKTYYLFELIVIIAMRPIFVIPNVIILKCHFK